MFAPGIFMSEGYIGGLVSRGRSRKIAVILFLCPLGGLIAAGVVLDPSQDRAAKSNYE